MVFSSLFFLFLFLPSILLGYFLVPNRWKNHLLLVASILFYSWGEGIYALLMLFSITNNWFFGLAIENCATGRRKKTLLGIAIALNLLPLLLFKYSYLFLSNLSSLIGTASFTLLDNGPIHLPIGISFFTFQAISYVMDVYRNTSRAQKNFINIGLYISFFPQLIAGPIVRYHDIAKEILSRRITAELFSEGLSRFIFGLAKKVLIANPMGAMSDTIFALPPDALSSPVAWLGVLCYSLQIYFDFSGYSDMAIGLGRMFGFHFLENFNYPFISRSIREFWKRWHISLSNWFLDYLYVPLGGNRKGTARTYTNLLIVFFLCGLWHGASWNFLLWGMVHGAFIALERCPLGIFLKKLPHPLQHVYFIFILLNTWVLFRIESLSEICNYYSIMYGFHNVGVSIAPIVHLLDLDFFLTFAVGALLSTPLCITIITNIRSKKMRVSFAKGTGAFLSMGHVVLLATLFFYSCLHLAVGSYNPFIYFRF